MYKDMYGGEFSVKFTVMEEPFLTFQKFNDPEVAAEMAAKLKEHRIEVVLDDSGKLFDPSFANNFLEREIRIKLRAADFEEADRVLKLFYRKQADRVEEDYYLYQFTDSELMDIIRNPDEWGYLDYALAQKILQEHGISIPSGELKRFQDEKMRLLSRPEASDKSWTWLGYLMALLAAPLGMIIGFSMAFMQRTLPDGQRLFAYNEQDRREGKRILTLASVCLACWILAWLWFWKR
ncbi:MAG: hypothetical protein Q8939_03950 [Bacteroidota bacterium]|nr:hypothetical protein [Bacteroidota bacterium]